MDTAVRRKMRFRALRYSVTLIAPAIALAGFLLPGIWTWMLVVYAFVLIPLLELFIPEDKSQLSEQEEEAALADPLFDVLLYMLVPVQWTMLIVFLFQVDDGDLTAIERLGRILTMGILCGIYGINVAHELGHRSKKWERDLARILLLSSLYTHFIIEHNRGHHSRVATLDDPASARQGESIYAFWVRSIVFSFFSAWDLEAKRLEKNGHQRWSFHNEMLRGLLVSVVLVSVVFFTFGLVPMLSFLAAAFIGILLLETVNYIEHYGLQRHKDDQGRYGRVMHVHSWNSDHMLGRLMLFELTRHSDHHWKASRKYQILKTHEEAPQLPAGYPGMMLLSLVPPLFFRVMHRRLEDLREANSHLALAR